MLFPVSVIGSNGIITFTIDCSQTFGSGLHESTKYCLEILPDLINENHHSVLDVGSGSGILALAAAKLGVKNVVACEISFQACKTAYRNIQNTGLSDQIDLYCGSIDAIHNHSFECILANIQGDIILEMKEKLPKLLIPGGKLLISGIAWDWLYDVKTTFINQKLDLINIVQGDEFSTLLFGKK